LRHERVDPWELNASRGDRPSLKGHKLTIGLDLGDRWSNYCVLDEAGEVLLEQKLATTPEAMTTASVVGEWRGVRTTAQ
jgi:predicted NBD/HSP70 family sugar kinase